MTKSIRYKLATAVTGTILAIGGLVSQHQRAPETILAKDTNIQYTYQDEQGKQVFGVLDDTKPLSAFAETDAIIETTSLFVAYDESAPPPAKRYLPTILNGTLQWPANRDRSAKWRPMPGGVSVGHPNITYGTSGDQVCYQGNCDCFLTNAHVAGAFDDGKVGDPIYQPGPHHGGDASDIIGYTVVMVTPLKNVNNTVDAAVVCGKRGDVYPGIYGIGQVNGVYEHPYIGMIADMCIANGCTKLRLVALDVTVKVAYYKKGSRVAIMRTFVHQLLWEGDTSPGASGGSIVKDRSNAGLFFSANSDGEALSNDMDYVLLAIPGIVP